jgi:tetratricopeptide (TPR) repeat protein
MLSMLCLVVVFGAHSLIDWTWYVPGDACAALLCAGWLAGRGPLNAAEKATDPSGPNPNGGARRAAEQPGARLAWLARLGYVRVGVAAAVIVAALLAAWSQWQPQRSEEARQSALALLARDPAAAARAADTAVSRDPLSAEALLTLADIQQVRGETALARATLQRAVRLQPSNPQTWLALARSDLTRHPRAALQELQAAIYLNPEAIAPEALAKERQAIEIHNDYIQALRAVAQASAAGASGASGSPARAAPSARRAVPRRGAPAPTRSRSPRAAR